MKNRERRAWLIVIVLIFTLIAVWGGSSGAVSAFIPPLIHTFGWSQARVSSLASIVAIGFTLGCPITGWLLDRIDVRIPVAVGAALTGGALLASSRVHSFDALATAHLIAGIGCGMATTVPAAAIVGNWFTRNRGLAMGLAMTGASAGGMITVQVVTRVTAASGWRSAYVALGVPIFIVIIPLIILVVRMRPPDADVPAASRETGAGTSALEGLTLWESLRTRSFWLLIILAIAWSFASTGTITQLFSYLIKIGYTNDAAAIVVSLAFGATAIGKSVFGLLADWIGSRGAEIVGALGLAIGCGLLIYVENFVVLALFLLIYGLAWGSILALLPLVTIDSLGLKYYGTVGGTIGAAVTLIGATSGPFFTGLLIDVTRSYAFVFGICGISAAISAILTLGCRPEFKRAAIPKPVLAPSEVSL